MFEMLLALFCFSLQSEDNEALIFSKIISLASMLSYISYISLLVLNKNLLINKMAYGPFTILSWGYIMTFLLPNLSLHIADEV